MMGDGADRLAVIGMGWIGAYMVPATEACWEKDMKSGCLR